MAALTSSVTRTQVFFDPTPLGVSLADIVTRAGDLPNPIRLGGSRLVVHIQTTPEAVDDLLALIRELAEEKARTGYVAPADALEVDESGDSTPFSNIYVRAGKKN